MGLTCAVCEKPFEAEKAAQSVCSVRCSVEIAKRIRKAAKAAEKARREASRPYSYWMRKAQEAFNGWIRARDEGRPCISCGRMHDGQWHAGHYRSTADAPALRFDPDNVHRQCSPCNRHLHGNLIAYRQGLLLRLGFEVLERLEAPQPARRWTVAELRQIRDEYRARLGDANASA